MTLPEDQAKRFFRHIIMPEISGLGQKKLMKCHVDICSSSVEEIAPLLYYLTAVGVGEISCNLVKTAGFERLVKNLKDINPSTIITGSSHEISGLVDNFAPKSCKKPCLKVIMGNKDFVTGKIQILDKTDFHIPAIMAIVEPWQGIISILKGTRVSGDDFLKTIDLSAREQKHLISEGLILSACFIGTLVVTEVIKSCLGIGKPLDNPLYFDLMSMTFTKKKINDLGICEDLKPYDQSKGKLFDKKVLIVGVGGLGSPAAFALTLIGVGAIGLVDGDYVELTNLNRQILHATSRIGMPKVESARLFLNQINPSIDIKTYFTNLTKQNVMEVIKDYDVIVAGLDNLPSRYLLNDACFLMNKPLVEAGVLRFNGMGRTILPRSGPCYRCIFPQIPSQERIPTTLDLGILGVVPGVMGFVQAIEVAKILGGVGKLLKNNLLLFEALNMEFRVPSFRKDPRCPLCGQKPTITSLQEYGNVYV